MDAASQKKIRVVVGMTGRVDSTVAAYLLKKQGLDVIGVTLIALDSITTTQHKLSSTCHVPDPRKVQEICRELAIPHYCISIEKQFREEVLESVLTARISGETFSPCVFCSHLRTKAMISKLDKLGADKIATGHYAKVSYNLNSDVYQLGASSDLEKDQSFLLSCLGQDELSKLMLPLSEVREKEVDRISKTLGVNFDERVDSKEQCFIRDKGLASLATAQIPEEFRKSGNMISATDESMIGEHEGVHHFYIGQRELALKDVYAIDKELEVFEISPRTGEVSIKHGKLIKHETTHFFLHEMTIDKRVDLTRPKRLFAKFGEESERHEVKLYYRNNGHCVVEFSTPLKKNVIRGEYIAFYDNNSKRSKFVTGGIIDDYGKFDGLDRLGHARLSAEEGMDDDERVAYREKRREKNLDFRF